MAVFFIHSCLIVLAAYVSYRFCISIAHSLSHRREKKAYGCLDVLQARHLYGLPFPYNGQVSIHLYPSHLAFCFGGVCYPLCKPRIFLIYRSSDAFITTRRFSVSPTFGYNLILRYLDEMGEPHSMVFSLIRGEHLYGFFQLLLAQGYSVRIKKRAD